MGILAISVSEGWYVCHLYQTEKEKQASFYKDVIAHETGMACMDARRENCMVGYDMKEKELVYVVDGERIVRKLAEGKSGYWLMTTPVYDVRDTSKWSLQSLNERIQEKIRGKRGKEMPLALTERDSAGKVLHSLQTRNAAEGELCRFAVPLGYLSQNSLQVEFSIPRGDIWKAIKEEAALLCAFGILAFLCVWLLFHHLRVERRNGEIRRFYMQMYRHDLRRLMGTAMNWLEVLRIRTKGRLTEEESQMATEGTEALEEVMAGIERMIAVQVCEHGLRARHEDVDMHALLGGLTNKEKWGLTGEKPVEFTTDFRAGNPMVEGDQELLESLFLNLVGNALKYSRERVEVRLATRELEGDRMEVTVEDNGTGIPPEMRERVFERGYRLERDKERRKGKGWGLYMVRRIAEAHKGSVRLEDAEGGGSRFTVTLRHKRKRIWG